MKICRILILLLGVVMMIGGCSYNGEEIRTDHAQSYPEELARMSRSIVEAYQGPLTLQDCIELAMKHGLAVKSAELQQRMARMDRNISFANFLPAVSLDAQRIWWDPNPMINFGGSGAALHDKDVREITWNIQMSIFNPATWFLHGMYRRGYEIATLANEYTRQGIAFQVTTLFYQYLSTEQMLELVKNQLAAAQAQAKELAAWQSEGLAAPWQADHARAGVLAKTAEVHHMQRSLDQARAELLTAMGLSPDAAVAFTISDSPEAPAQSLDELMAEALINHPNLAIADRKIAIEKQKVKLAIAGFLPSLAGVASHMNTSDSHQVYSNYWMGGLVGTISVFNGFADVNQYKAAKAGREAAFIEREQATLTLMIQVMRAFDQVRTAQDMVSVASLARQAAEGRLNEIQDQHDQGLIQASELLSVSAETDKARIQAVQANYQYQVSIAALMNIIGRTKTHFEDSHEQAAK